MRKAILVIAVLTIIGFTQGNAQGPPPFNVTPPVAQARIAIVQTLYGYLPSGVLETPSADPNRLFSPNVQGRVTPLGDANDLETVREYFFGLNRVTFSGLVSSFTFNSLVASNDRVFVDVDITFAQTSAQQAAMVQITLHQIGFFRFNNANQIISFDLTIPYLGAALDSEGVDLSDPNTANSLAEDVCNAHALSCTGANQQYSDHPSCRDFLQTLPFGTFDRLIANDLACRFAQSQFTAINPNMVCPALGPNGGSVNGGFICSDKNTYASYFSRRY